MVCSRPDARTRTNVPSEVVEAGVRLCTCSTLEQTTLQAIVGREGSHLGGEEEGGGLKQVSEPFGGHPSSGKWRSTILRGKVGVPASCVSFRYFACRTHCRRQLRQKGTILQMLDGFVLKSRRQSTLSWKGAHSSGLAITLGSRDKTCFRLPRTRCTVYI